MTPMLIAVPLLCLGALQAPDTLRYTVILGGNRDPAAVYRTPGVLPWRARR